MREQFIDPVCGMTVKPESTAVKFKFVRKTTYFCSNDYHAKFTVEFAAPASPMIQLGGKKVTGKDLVDC